jgi:hypothetical protein
MSRGGAYMIHDDGELRERAAATRDHPEGNRPRDAAGVPLDLPPPAPPVSGDDPPASRRGRRISPAALAAGDS